VSLNPERDVYQSKKQSARNYRQIMRSARKHGRILWLPNSHEYRVWTVTIAMLTLYNVYSVPQHVLLTELDPISFGNWLWLAMDWTFDIFFLSNIYLKMHCLCVLDGDQMLLSRNEIRAAYIWTRSFFVDVLAVLPLELVLLWTTSVPVGYLRLNRLLHINSCKVL